MGLGEFFCAAVSHAADSVGQLFSIWAGMGRLVLHRRVRRDSGVACLGPGTRRARVAAGGAGSFQHRLRARRQWLCLPALAPPRAQAGVHALPGEVSHHSKFRAAAARRVHGGASGGGGKSAGGAGALAGRRRSGGGHRGHCLLCALAPGPVGKSGGNDVERVEPDCFYRGRDGAARRGHPSDA